MDDNICINCELGECIYNRNKKCMLNSVTINSMGMCEDCIVPDIPANLMEYFKKLTIEKLHGD